MRIFVTGANGFVGRPLCASLLSRQHQVRAMVRGSHVLEHVETVRGSEINGETEWSQALRDVDVVIHLAARVHVMRERAENPLAEFRKVNVQGTEHLAREAAKAGVRRLVYVSSVKVNGEQTCEGSKFIETDNPAPEDAYGISKWEAEQVLHRVAAETGLEAVIVRPPLVYGTAVKGNFAQMLKILAKGIPLPLASVANQRSLISVQNLTDVLVVCATHPAASGQTYLVSDGEDISTSCLLQQLGDAIGHPAHLFPFPRALLRLAGRLSGKADQVERLLGSLQVDDGKIRRELNWTPPLTLQQGLQATAEWYRNAHL